MSRGGSVAWGPVVLVMAVGLAGGGVAGGLVGAPPDPTDTPPTRPADPGADFPDGVRSYLPKAAVSPIRSLLARNEYECEPDPKAELAKKQETCWSPDGLSADARVTLAYDSERQVRYADAKCELGPQSPRDYCHRLFRFMVESVYAGQPTFRKQAGSWAAKNLENEAVTVIGGMELSVELQQHAIRIYPEG
jgi:hypothetical protein